MAQTLAMTLLLPLVGGRLLSDLYGPYPSVWQGSWDRGFLLSSPRVDPSLPHQIDRDFPGGGRQHREG